MVGVGRICRVVGVAPEHPRVALIVWLFPLVMAAVVITTGNHYVLDVAGSVALLTVSIAAAAAWGRYRRRRARPASTR